MRRCFALTAIALASVALPAEAALLRVLTYNIHHGVGNDSALNLSRIASVILASNADLVSLQEVDHGVPRSNSVEQVNRLAELTGMTGYFGKARNLDGGGYGNGVLVKPGIDVVNVVNRALPNPDNVEPRAVLELGLSVDATPTTAEFKFFATHLAHDNGAGRTASVNYINDLASTSAVPSILAGDMNIRPDYSAYGLLQQEWTDVTNINNSGKNRDNQIDYVFVRSATQWNVVTQSQFIVNATTNVASDHHPLLGVVELDEPTSSTLAWNDNSGSSVGFSNGFAAGNGSQGVGDYPSSPWENGIHSLLLGYGGRAIFSGNASRTAASLRIGTNQSNAVIAGRNGDGTMTASNSVSLMLVGAANSSGDLVVGEGAYQGTLNWNSSGTLEAQGRVRVGEGGIGLINQTGGAFVADSGDDNASFVGIGVGIGGDGTYRLDRGTFRPGGGFLAAQPRQTILGDKGGVGALFVGDGTGAVNTAYLQTAGDVVVGQDGGSAMLQVRSDGRVELRSMSVDAELIVGQRGVGEVVQTGGTVVYDDSLYIGTGADGEGVYSISGGALMTASDDAGSLQLGSHGGAGTLRISSEAIVSHQGALQLAEDANAHGSGRLEMIGSAASLHFKQLANADGRLEGGSETMFWQADAGGVTPLVIDGNGGIIQPVQLQHPEEFAANISAGATLAGDGIALQLDLSNFLGSQVITLIDNRSSQPITGFFENSSSGMLYDEGAELLGSGFSGTVTISYQGSSSVGSTGNDVVLQLAAGGESADFDGDGDVDGADFLDWQRGERDPARLQAWKLAFGHAANARSAIVIPEPTTVMLCAAGLLACWLRKVR